MTDESSQPKPKKQSIRFYLIVATVLLIAAVVGAVAFFLFNNIQTYYGPGPIEIEVISNKLVFAQSEDISLTIYVDNLQDWPVPYPLEVTYQIDRNGNFVDGYTVFAEPPPGRISTFPAHSRTLWETYVWNQKIGTGNNRTQVLPGNYTFTVSFGQIVDHGHGGNCTFEIR